MELKHQIYMVKTIPEWDASYVTKRVSLTTKLRYSAWMSGFVTYLKLRSRFAAGVIALMLLVLASVTLPAFNGDSGSLMAQTSEAISRFIGRSPGERGETDLIKTKIKRAKGKPGDKLLATAPRAKPAEAEERALGKIFDTPPEEAVQSLTGVPIGPLALGNVFPSDFGDFGDVAGGGGVPGGGFPGGISTVIPSATPGGPTGPTDPANPVDPTNPTNPTDPVGAVPEPGTWVMMIVGFALCGASLRRRRKWSSAPSVA